MTSELLIKQLHELYELPAGALSAGTDIEDIPGWSSMAFISLMAMVNDEYGVMLSPSHVQQSRTIEDLAKQIEWQEKLRHRAA